MKNLIYLLTLVLLASCSTVKKSSTKFNQSTAVHEAILKDSAFEKSSDSTANKKDSTAVNVSIDSSYEKITVREEIQFITNGNAWKIVSSTTTKEKGRKQTQANKQTTSEDKTTKTTADAGHKIEAAVKDSTGKTSINVSTVKRTGFSFWRLLWLLPVVVFALVGYRYKKIIITFLKGWFTGI